MPRRSAKKHAARDATPEGTTWSQPIPAWPARERPRERLLLQGPAALSDAELVAVLLGNGTPGADAVTTGRALLASAGSVGRLLAGVSELAHVPGVGPVKRARLIAALELARRSLGEGLTELPAIRGVEDCYDFLKARLGNLNHEIFACLFLDVRHRVITFEVLSEGTINEATVYPREVVRACLRHHASAVILVHNHPSGDASPSVADCEITELIRDALDLLEVKLVDHIVVGAGKPVSMVARGLA
ncbi:DNA repair protein RadC [Luteibacter aegosomaticola]|uniref:RadC family protein n=1 Tax=Luteibacter aegosomaticola TaxID=2911538 RepID=UPI001FF95177|nr:DNA repair protein RadC [Luteibacter aegosomaticola]UPG89948.1 DNA repair protein RadC [Luteibacter aegosomaticola]